ncbi:MAG TPA: saccharopine dehydrogenase C-terminal domain-containing protein [Chitinophagaceae bacterium]|nr:saccharopine dehydrogenase C-terminal domain-containing protein [Chitinophagaceae bacterium]
MTIAVLGAGMIGRAIALDLANQHEVTSFDLSKVNLEDLQNKNPAINIAAADFLNYNDYANWLQPFDLVVTAVPGQIGYKTLEAVIQAGKNVVDISFFPEDALQLNKLAFQKKVTAITDCGVAPGLSNLILGRYNEEMKIESFSCYVGGLPKERKKTFEYKAPFSPEDVIQEYIRAVRLMEKGNLVTKPALSDREIIEFDEIGQLEAFNTDGLRSLVQTMTHIPDMKEKTLRYPGHADFMIALQQSGFFETTPIRIKDADISPLEFTSKLLIHEWKLGPEEEEFTVMRVTIKGIKEGKKKTIEYNLLDRFDNESKLSSMARTTGFTCTAVVNLLAQDRIDEHGVFPPEWVGKDKKNFDFVLEYLAKRNVRGKFTGV